MSAIPARAVTAARWRALQLAGVNLLFFVRLLILARLLAPDAFGTIAVANVARYCPSAIFAQSVEEARTVVPSAA